MTESITVAEKAYAKINISLDVTRKRADGYHDMVMVMQTVSLCDDLQLLLNREGRTFARTNLSFIPGDDQNLAVKAAKAFFSAVSDPETGAEITIKKNIPVGAGMAGGSADAAAVLRALNRAYDSPLSVAQLLSLGETVGSDVPYCIVGGTKLAQGRGEILSELPALPECLITVCKPSFSISTPDLFRRLDRVSLRCHPDTEGIITALQQQNLKQVCRRLYNVFEDTGDRRLRTVAAIKSCLLDHGAEGAVMTGTGSAVFGIFQAPDKAEAAAVQLRKEYGFACVTRPVNIL